MTIDILAEFAECTLNVTTILVSCVDRVTELDHLDIVVAQANETYSPKHDDEYDKIPRLYMAVKPPDVVQMSLIHSANDYTAALLPFTPQNGKLLICIFSSLG
jgi:hypothetical protein